MDPIALSERLLLREMTPDDAADAYGLNNDPEVLRYTGDAPFATVAEAREFLAAYPDYRLHGFGRWAVVRRADHRWLGWCGLKRHANGEVDLGYRLLRMHWGQGYATEAARTCLELGFERYGLRTIIGRVVPAHTASIRVLEKLGAQRWRTERDEHGIEVVIYRMDRPQAPIG